MLGTGQAKGDVDRVLVLLSEMGADVNMRNSKVDSDHTVKSNTRNECADTRCMERECVCTLSLWYVCRCACYGVSGTAVCILEQGSARCQ